MSNQFRYKILTGGQTQELNELVEDHINDGWELYGTPYASKEERHHQAVRKNDWKANRPNPHPKPPKGPPLRKV